MAEATDGPRLDRDVEVHFKGDWGQANIHRICGWLAQEVGDRNGPGSRFAIWNGRGGTDAVRALAAREVDVAVATPAAFAAMAVRGCGPYAGESHPELRALGTVPQKDRLVLAIGAEHGIRSFDDLRQKRPPLRIATSPDDGVNHVGLAAQAVMAAHGVPRTRFESWGGRYLEDERPFPCQAWLLDGSADAILHEAIMTPGWRKAAEARPLTFVPMEDDALASLEEEFGWPRAILGAGYLRGVDRDLPTLDFSDFVLLVREEMDEELAYLLAWCMGETRDALEVQYRHLPPERSPVTYPLDPKTMGRTPVALHPGAARYYEVL